MRNLKNILPFYAVPYKVKEEVKYYTDALQGKISSVTKMTTQLTAPYNPKPDEATAA